jgi:hypothetical protein
LRKIFPKNGKMETFGGKKFLINHFPKRKILWEKSFEKSAPDGLGKMHKITIICASQQL